MKSQPEREETDWEWEIPVQVPPPREKVVDLSSRALIMRFPRTIAASRLNLLVPALARACLNSREWEKPRVEHPISVLSFSPHFRSPLSLSEVFSLKLPLSFLDSAGFSACSIQRRARWWAVKALREKSEEWFMGDDTNALNTHNSEWVIYYCRYSIVE